MSMTLKSGAKFEEKQNCCFKKDKNLVNFDIYFEIFIFIFFRITTEK